MVSRSGPGSAQYMMDMSLAPALAAATYSVTSEPPVEQRDTVMEIPTDVIVIMLLHHGAGQQAA
ncbi:hypothetical protein FHT78_002172 [Rhizobium sp. BK196]|jgi:hypothetical protein|nr:hypothetical protein [Rhizobium sp. BK196]